MSTQLAFQHETKVLIAICRGTAALSDMRGVIDAVEREATAGRYRLCALNLLNIEINLGQDDHVQLGIYAAQKLAKLERVASIVPFQYRTGISEQSAQRSGLRLRTFISLEEGIAWAETG